jgi:DNA end-binding protein Ku
MTETGKVGIAKVVIRQKESLVALRPIGDVLGMATLLFADEVVDAATIDEVPDPEEVEVKPREREIAEQLVESLAGAWEPERYRDTYRDDVLALIERKAAGEEIAVQPAVEEEASPAPDLMAALKASLDAVRERSGDGAKKPAAKKPAAKKPAAKKS